MSNTIFCNLIYRCRPMRHLFFVAAMLSAVPVDAADPEVVLIVGEERFLRFELDEVINSFVPAAIFHGGVTDEKRKKYIPRAVEVLINRALLYRGALAAGIQVDPNEVKSIIEENIDKFGSKKKFEEAVKNRGLTLERFEHRIIQQKAVTEYIQSGLVKQSRYSKKELQAYYDEHPQEFDRPETVGLWHIILKVKPNAPNSKWIEKRKLAEDIVNRARSGEDFAELASKHSEDDYRVKGGWIGYMHKGRLLPALEKEAFGLKKNEIAGPVRSLQGYHIIKAGDRKPAELIPFKEASPGLKKRLEKARFKKLKNELLNRLKKDVEIKVLVDMQK